MQEHTAGLNEGLSRVTAGTSAFGTDADGLMYLLELGGRSLKVMPEFAAADWDTDGTVNSGDFFAYLTDFLNGNADLDGDQATTGMDFFVYLDLFFRG